MSMQSNQRIAGVDEAGRGALAGPVVAAACILPAFHSIRGIKDSKLLTASQREVIYEQLTKHPDTVWSVGIVDHETIDQINILQATLLAMKMAIDNLLLIPDLVLVDGNQLPKVSVPCSSVIGGDRIHIEIAAASIIAKVTRDRLADKWHDQFPSYGFKQHKGYGTKLHREKIKKHGLSSIHRKSFKLK